MKKSANDEVKIEEDAILFFRFQKYNRTRFSDLKSEVMLWTMKGTYPASQNSMFTDIKNS